jgi:hypothetical protein
MKNPSYLDLARAIRGEGQEIGIEADLISAARNDAGLIGAQADMIAEDSRAAAMRALDLMIRAGATIPPAGPASGRE